MKYKYLRRTGFRLDGGLRPEKGRVKGHERAFASVIKLFYEYSCLPRDLAISYASIHFRDFADYTMVMLTVHI